MRCRRAAPASWTRRRRSGPSKAGLYRTDLAHIHDMGFGSFAKRVAPQIDAILHDRGLDGGEVVEIGCGSGAVARHLAAAGFRVRAWDSSPAMVRLARQKAPGVPFRVGSIEGLRIPRCHAIVSVGEVMTYVKGGLPVLRRFFARAYEALRPGGVLLFDFIASVRGRTYLPKVLRGRGWQITVSASFDRSARVVTRRMSMRRLVNGRTRFSRETHRVHVYPAASIVAALERCGFGVKTARSFGRVHLLPGDLAVTARKDGRL
jgi:SAM-dependent methyltransferase